MRSECWVIVKPGYADTSPPGSDKHVGFLKTHSSEQALPTTEYQNLNQNSRVEQEINMMDLKEYFENTNGLGVIASADTKGRVNAAVYARPHIMEDGLLAFIMRDRITYENVRGNPHATFLFKEEGSGYKGKRLYLTKVREEDNAEVIESIRRRSYLSDKNSEESTFLVYFRVDNERPLIGD
jgi:hypothetical protein